MTARSFLCSLVSDGPTSTGECPDCSEERMSTGMYGLADEGPVLLGSMTICGCGEFWRCAFCGARLPLDGELSYSHIATQHAEAE